MQPRNNAPYLVVGCTRQLSHFSFFQLHISEYHRLHATEDFFHLDLNSKFEPDEVGDFFEMVTPRQFQLIYFEACSLFKGSPHYNLSNQAYFFIEKCNRLLSQGGIILINGVIPNQKEHQIFAESGFDNLHTIDQRGDEYGWCIYHKNPQQDLTFDISKLSQEAQALVKASGYGTEPQYKP